MANEKDTKLSQEQLQVEQARLGVSKEINDIKEESNKLWTKELAHARDQLADQIKLKELLGDRISQQEVARVKNIKETEYLMGLLKDKIEGEDAYNEKLKEQEKIVANINAQEALLAGDQQRLEDAQKMIDRLKERRAEQDKYTEAELAAMIKVNKLEDQRNESHNRIVSSIEAGARGFLGMEDTSKSLTNDFAVMVAHAAEGESIWRTVAGNIFTVEFATDLASAAAEKMSEALFSLMAEFKAMITELDTASVGFRKATGAGMEYDKMLMDTYSSTGDLAKTHAELGDSMATLYSQTTVFTEQGKAGQKAMVEFAAGMENVGVSNESTGKSFQILMKGMQMSRVQAQAAIVGLTDVAQALKVPMAQLMEGFQASMPELMKYGPQAVEQFKKVAAAAKATGIETTRLLAIAKQFDTYEGAADSVGKLNAILGGPYLNSIEMLNAKEHERIDMLRQTIAQSGKSWQSMGRFERQAIATAAGITDMNEAGMLFGTDTRGFDEYQRKQAVAAEEAKNLEEMQKANVVMTAKLGRAFREFVVHLQPLISFFRGIVEWVAKLSESLGGSLIPILMGLYGVFKLTQIALAINNAYLAISAARTAFAASAEGTLSVAKRLSNALTAANSVVKGTNAAASVAEGTADAGAAIEKEISTIVTAEDTVVKGANTTATWAGVAATLAYGAAALLVILGIVLLVYAIADLAEAMKGMGADALGLALVIGVLMAGLYFLIPAIAAAGATAGLAAVPMLAFGAAVLMIGGGLALVILAIGVAAKGIAELVQTIGAAIAKIVDSLGSLIDKIASGVATVLGAIASFVVTIVPPLLLLSVAILVVAVAVGVLAMSLISMGAAAPFAFVGLAILQMTLMSLVVALGAIAFALAFISTDDLQALGDIMGGLGSIGVETASSILMIADAIEHLAEVADDMNFEDMIEISYLLNTVKATASAPQEGLIATSRVFETMSEYNKTTAVANTDVNESMMELVEKLGEVSKSMGAAAGAGGGQQSSVVLSINERELGRAVMKNVNKRYGVNKLV